MTQSSPLWLKASAAFVQKNLTGHKILGLATAALLYLICLSGTATVFYLDMQRWEAASAPDVVFTPSAIANAIEDSRRFQPAGTTTLTATLPTHAFPRLTINAGKDHLAYDNAGRFVGKTSTPVVEGLSALHYELNIPGIAGGVLVGLGGVAITALLIGGLLAHPRIFKDAFLWRFRAGARMNRSDLHNRIGVWASPFHLAIALTGALIGLAQIILLVVGLSVYKGDLSQASAPLYGDLSVKTVEGRMSKSALISAFDTLKDNFPGAQPSYILLNNFNSDHESLTVWAEMPDRLIYAEQFEFDGKGVLTTRHHMNDGPLGKQIYASLYRIHFGSFGGLAVRWVYFWLGLGLTAICATGMDIWLMKSAQKGRSHPRLHRLWVSFVWAAPIAMCMAALAGVTFGTDFAILFWPMLTLLSLAGLALSSANLTSKTGRLLLAASLIAIVSLHTLKFAGASWLGTALWVNVSLLVIAALSALSVLKTVPKYNL